MTDQPRQLATCRSYGDLHAALRARAEELDVSRATIDEVAGLAATHAGKLLAPVPIKHLGPDSLGPLLGALGLVLLVVEDKALLDRLAKRLKKRRRPSACAISADGASDAVLASKRRRKRTLHRKSPDWGRIMNARRNLLMSAARRKAIARIAARWRWRKSIATATHPHPPSA